ncbi:hypothetical protein [Nitratireductor thuwali]|uniref:DUF3828 domain-containing protein n=1 Tax=Nitratireductor thuwali TaxID=2267699 RepID=A0ABY5MES7_9HYPH|nr:hypothetical protein NTH_00982 [Nitratireductor thuwali]
MPIAASAAILFINTTLSAASPTLSQDEAAAFVQRFCTTLIPAVADYDANASDGAWPPDDLAVFGPLVTPELAELVQQAIEYSAASQAATDGKPPLGDGIPWTAGDTASDCTAGAITGTAEKPEVEVHYQFFYDSTQGWTDRLVLSRHAGEWRVDDILFGIFDYASGLRASLTAVIDEPIPQ